MIGNTCLFQSSVQASELFVYTISVLNSFLSFIFFLFFVFLCPMSYCITSFHKGMVSRYFPGKTGDWKTSYLTKMTVCGEQQSMHVKGPATDHHNIYILWF